MAKCTSIVSVWPRFIIPSPSDSFSNFHDEMSMSYSQTWACNKGVQPLTAQVGGWWAQCKQLHFIPRNLNLQGSNTKTEESWYWAIAEAEQQLMSVFQFLEFPLVLSFQKSGFSPFFCFFAYPHMFSNKHILSFPLFLPHFLTLI